jgi:hypothetical protein
MMRAYAAEPPKRAGRWRASVVSSAAADSGVAPAASRATSGIPKRPGRRLSNRTYSEIQRSDPSFGKANSGGITPTTVRWRPETS